jgi:hypothetical protein
VIELSPKERLTVTVDPDVLEKAKALNVNLSQITQASLRALTTPKLGPDAHQGYESFFNDMKPLLAMYDAKVEVAYYVDNSQMSEDGTAGIQIAHRVYLWPDGVLRDRAEVTFNDDMGSPMPEGSVWDTELKNVTDIRVSDLHSPREILSNLLDVLAEKVPERKEMLKELDIARRQLHAISSSLIGLVGKKKASLKEVHKEKQTTHKKRR